MSFEILFSIPFKTWLATLYYWEEFVLYYKPLQLHTSAAVLLCISSLEILKKREKGEKFLSSRTKSSYITLHKIRVWPTKSPTSKMNEIRRILVIASKQLDILARKFNFFFLFKIFGVKIVKDSKLFWRENSNYSIKLPFRYFSAKIQTNKANLHSSILARKFKLNYQIGISVFWRENSI